MVRGAEANAAATGLPVKCSINKGIARIASPSPSRETDWPAKNTCDPNAVVRHITAIQTRAGTNHTAPGLADTGRSHRYIF